MHRLTRNKARQNAICRRMRDGKERKRLSIGNAVDLVPRFKAKDLRKVVVVIDFDFGVKIDTFRFKKTNRINSYLVNRNNDVTESMGWSKFCKKLSVYYPSVLSERSL